MFRRMILAIPAAVLLGSAASATALGAPATGCPSGEGWGEWTIEAAAERIWPALIDSSPFPGGIADFEAAVAGYDRNADGTVCIKIMWGDDLNPNAHWYRVGLELLGSPVEQFLSRDNNSAA